MISARKIAAIVGALFLIALITNFLGSTLLENIIHGPGYLARIYPNRAQVIAGLLLELTSAAAVVGIPVMLYPILKRYSEPVALGYFGFRLIESATVFVGNLGPRSLLTLSQEYVKSGALDVSYFETLGSLFQAERYWAYPMLGIVFCAGALLFYYLLFRSRLIPRFISAWGFIGAALLLAGLVLSMFDNNTEVIIYAAPIALNEVFLAIWLMVKGFNPSALTSGSGKAYVNEMTWPHVK